MINFIKTTFMGGIIFLIPIVIFVFVIEKALQVIRHLTTPLINSIQTGTTLAPFAAHLLAILVLVGICFLFGLLARAKRAQFVVATMESRFLQKIPAYSYLKARAESVINPEDMGAMRPIAVRFDDSCQLAFEVDRTDGGQIIAYLPGAPDPWSGSICLVDADRVSPLDITLRSAAMMLQRLGLGSRDIFAGVARGPKP